MYSKTSLFGYGLSEFGIIKIRRYFMGKEKSPKVLNYSF